MDKNMSISSLNGGLFVSRGQGSHPKRIIDSYEIIFVVSGELDIYEEKRKFKVLKDERLLLYPGKKHRGLSDYDGDLSFFWIHFRIKRDSDDFIQHAKIKRPEKLTEWFRLFLDEQEQSVPGREQMDFLMGLVWTECCKTGDVEDSCAKALATEARNKIKTSFASDINASLIAHSLGCNPDYLGRVYKRSFNSTITEDINSARLSYAKKLLLSGKMRIEEIMDASGFNDPAYFRRSFRKKFNMTPGRFRKVCACYHVNTE
ncbi:MAG: AraC family transcriptional regulator [Lentisphaerota bacterium]